MGNYSQYIIECMADKQIENKIKSIGKVKYELPFINRFVLEVEDKNKNILHQLGNQRQIHKNTNITAQMDTAKKTVKANLVNDKGYTGHNISICIIYLYSTIYSFVNNYFIFSFFNINTTCYSKNHD